ncbi:type II secretion system protein GspL [Plesiomonas shigelloides]|uniref:type II secretion system protein GspL n=1 Tax=Plesiomonas shigelloides TaxID=703 RepID=UPI001C0521CB|nr:type II secretion system protein GspL [Plesiomonas shigelloides]QWK94701.1 type II secretion system protein GspL [Plesiomonas shigelloides]
MSEVLLLRVIPGASPRLCWWQVQPAVGEIRARGESVSFAALAEAQPSLLALPLWLLLPGQWFSVCACRLQPARGRQLARLLPALLEDELAQDIETLHFSLLPRQHDSGHVAVIERSVLRQWYEAAMTSGFNLQALWPDWLALPSPSSSSESNLAATLAATSVSSSATLQHASAPVTLTVLNSMHGLLVRRYDPQHPHDWQGCSAEPLLAAPFLTALSALSTPSSSASTVLDVAKDVEDLAAASAQLPENVIARAKAPETKPDVAPQVVWYGLAASAEQLSALGLRGPLPKQVNNDEGALLLRGASALHQLQRHGILGGEFAPRSAQARQWRQWRSIAAALAMLALLLVGEQGVRWWQLTQAADQAATQAEQAYRALFPQQTRRVNMRAQLNAVLRQMRGQPPLQGLVPYLRKVALALQDPALSRQPLQVKSLQYQRDQQSLRLQVQAAGFAELEQLRSVLGRYFQVEQGALSRDGAGVAGSLVLRDRAVQNQSAAAERQTRAEPRISTAQ